MVKKIYYYNDSLIAAWMLRNYAEVGFKLYKPAEGVKPDTELSYQDLVGAAYNKSVGIEPVIAPPYHVRPSSLPVVRLIIDCRSYFFYPPIEGEEKESDGEEVL